MSRANSAFLTGSEIPPRIFHKVTPQSGHLGVFWPSKQRNPLSGHVATAPHHTPIRHLVLLRLVLSSVLKKVFCSMANSSNSKTRLNPPPSDDVFGFQRSTGTINEANIGNFLLCFT
ncbi:unnamed protein product [Owenia fusiformis]|uniref:Uncharacterized protein n=1 Tax=Owenia fusiformis TaxID=6347 RepID=A0A8J1Y8V9_OWEFU|nr:unnamed protein product [Owenia fusiformis]